MAINKVVYGDDTLIDLTNTTATADRIVSGTGAYGADGVWMDGTLTEVFPSDDNPAMDGTASPGVSINYSRADHVHPHDSSIPTKTSDLTNDSGFITGITSTDVTTALGYTPPMQDTTYESKTAASGGTDVSLVTTGEKYTWNNKGNGTITGINMNGASKGTSGIVDLGTVITAHQDISGKADKSATVSNVAYNSTNNKITKTINGTTSDVVSIATIKSALQLTKADVKLGQVDNVQQYSSLNPPPYPGPNLLDNWYFVGGGSQLGYGVFPVNQRGLTTYSSTGFTVDRWAINAPATVTLLAGGAKIQYNSTDQRWLFWQYINCASLAGKTITISRKIVGRQGSNINAVFQFLDSGGSGFGFTTLPDSGTESFATYPTTVPSNAARIRVGIFASTGVASGDYVTLEAIKMEIGSSQTFAHQENGVWVLNEVPDYETELLRCKTSTADPSDSYANGSVEFGNNIGIVQNTNKATQSISKGQYVIWHGALYKASSAITSGTTLSSSNLTAAQNGGLNDLKNNFGVKSISELGLATPTKIRNIVNALPYGASVVISITGGQVSDANFTGELYIRTPASSNVIHKTDLVLRVNTGGTTSLNNSYLLGMLPGSGDTKWYVPALTERQ